MLFGDQLFAFKYLKCVRRSLFFMAEDEAMCTRLPYHKHKLLFMLSAMRHYAAALRRSGLTLNYLYRLLQSREPKTLRIAALLDKPSRRVQEVNADYIGFQIPDKFVVGYGLDYAEKYRNLPDVCVVSLPKH